MTSSSWKPWVIGVVALVVCGATYLWLATMIDRHEDRPKPMYDSVLKMAALQTERLAKGGDVLPVDLDHSEHIKIDGTRFRPAPGVRVQVTVRGDGYCVQGWNQYGDKTALLCGDAQNKP